MKLRASYTLTLLLVLGCSDASSHISQSGVDPALRIQDLSNAEYEKFCKWQLRTDPYLAVEAKQLCVIDALASREDTASCEQAASACDEAGLARHEQHEVENDGAQQCELAEGEALSIHCRASVHEVETCLGAITSAWKRASCADDRDSTKKRTSEACAPLIESCPDVLRSYALLREEDEPKFTCNDGSVIPISYTCDLVADCPDGEDEDSSDPCN